MRKGRDSVYEFFNDFIDFPTLVFSRQILVHL